MINAVSIECLTTQPKDNQLESLECFHLISTHLQARHDLVRSLSAFISLDIATSLTVTREYL